MDEVATTKRSGRAVKISVVAAIGGFLFGFDTAVINGAVDSIRAAFGLSSAATGLAVASALVGSAIGAWFAGPVADRIGRIRVMVIASIVFAISSLGAGCAVTVWDFTAWRVLGGIGVGIASVIAPAYIAEIAPAELRGRLGSLQQLAIVLGIFAALLVDALFARVAGGAGHMLWLGGVAWRWMFIAGLVPSIAYGVLAARIPESPRYLIAKGKLEAAATVLREVLGDIDIQGKIVSIAATMKSERVPSLRDLRGGRFGLLGIVWSGIALSAFQQFVGINVIFYYSSVLWESVGFSENNSLIITVITSVVNVVTTLVAISLIDRWGRRPLLLTGSVGMAITLGIMAFVFAQAPLDAQGQPHLQGISGPIALLAANVYVFAFGMSWGPVVWVLLGEKFPNSIRAAALSVAAGAQWIANWVISTTFPSLKNAGLGLAYGVYTFFALLSIYFVWKYVRESKGQELEDMTSGG
jgi:SP family sugar:H+ symporter-like MFS transporter